MSSQESRRPRDVPPFLRRIAALLEPGGAFLLGVDLVKDKRVLEAAYDSSGNVLKFAADLEQHCEGGNPALFGSIRYNSAVTITPRRTQPRRHSSRR